ncbi:MAG: DUF1016 domain-containing protein [Deltaproteobacteria bacterium]|nr:DUF1016 domain-containing protein [Deltaproteobacteria bacterium]
MNEEFFNRIREILKHSRNHALQTINATMVRAYWEMGREIVEEEQRGANRAGYGEQLIRELSKRLSREFGQGFKERNLRNIRLFYQAYPKWQAVPAKLTWTHYLILSRVESHEARAFYEKECVEASWSTRELERQISSLLYDRLALSKDKEGLMALSQKENGVFQPSDVIKDPYVLEFTGLPQAEKFQESDLEQALINHLEKFLLELGRDFFFVARQQRICIDGDNFYIDLVFYHRLLRCFVLIDLKVGKLTQQDIGQMLLYTGYYEAENMKDGENPPVGLILCADKNDAVVRYTLSKSTQQVFASRYKLYLPTEEELAKELRREREQVEIEQRLKEKP